MSSPKQWKSTTESRFGQRVGIHFLYTVGITFSRFIISPRPVAMRTWTICYILLNFLLLDYATYSRLFQWKMVATICSLKIESKEKDVLKTQKCIWESEFWDLGFRETSRTTEITLLYHKIKSMILRLTSHLFVKIVRYNAH